MSNFGKMCYSKEDLFFLRQSVTVHSTRELPDRLQRVMNRSAPEIGVVEELELNRYSDSFESKPSKPLSLRAITSGVDHFTASPSSNSVSPCTEAMHGRGIMHGRSTSSHPHSEAPPLEYHPSKIAKAVRPKHARFKTKQ